MWPGHEAWVTRDYGGEGKALTLSKERLGLFAFHLLSLGGHIHSTYVMNARYPRSYVQFGISLPPGKKEELERLTGITLEQPSVLTPASGGGLSL